ncbi:hypothetical protein ACH4VM_25010 [Streptomyces sp. NPDC020792]|uniref:hypothetical protein n=1 Tax=Streptomyces sp. NPDC020792 TaxID=3365089 RepID=UPI0037B51E80
MTDQNGPGGLRVGLVGTLLAAVMGAAVTVTVALMGPAAGSGGGAAGPGPGSSTTASGTDAVPPGGRFRRYIAARLLHTGGFTGGTPSATSHDPSPGPPEEPRTWSAPPPAPRVRVRRHGPLVFVARRAPGPPTCSRCAALLGSEARPG